MVPWSHFSIHKTLLEEVETLSDIDQLKQIVKNLIRENLILSRRTNTALKSLENQNTLIKYLQETLISMMARNAMQVSELWALLGSEALRTFDDVARYQMLILDVATRYNKTSGNDKQIVKELKKAAFSVPYTSVSEAREKCARFLRHLRSRAHKRSDYENAENTVQRKKTSNKFQNNKVRTFAKKRKRNYREIAKRKACATSRKHSLNKSQNSKSDSNSKRKFQYVKMTKMAEKSQSDINVSPKLPRSPRLKRKAEQLSDNSCLNSGTEKSLSVNKTFDEKTESTKKLRRTYSTSKSIDDTVKLTPCFITLNDFMTDPAADNDQFVAQYKQLYVYKDTEENEYEVLDDAGDDMDSDQRAESEHNSDNESCQDQISTKSHESEDNQEKDPVLLKSTASEDIAAELPKNAISNGKKGPCTPPLSPSPDDYTFKRGPRTPPLPRRGPRTPPGTPLPHIDSEATDDDGDSSDSSSLSTA